MLLFSEVSVTSSPSTLLHDDDDAVARDGSELHRWISSWGVGT